MTRAGDGPVLVVDFAINVAFVGGSHDASNLLLKAVGPGLEAGPKRSRPSREAQHSSTVDLHEVPIVTNQIFVKRQWLRQRAIQQHQLRFNATYAGGQHKRLDNRAKQKHFIRGA